MASSEAVSYLGTAAIILGAVGGGITLLDWSLPKNSKVAIQDTASTFWLWVSYQKTWPYIRALRTRRAFNIFLATGLILPGLMAVFAFVMVYYPTLMGFSPNEDVKFEPPGVQLWIFPAIISVLCLLPALIYFILRRVSLKVYLWATNVPNVWSYLGRFLLCYVLILLSTVVINIPTIALLFALFPNPEIGLTQNTSSLFLVLFLVTWLIGWITMLIAWIASMGYFFLALYVVAIIALIATFKILNFIVLRLLEYDKGPLLGISVALTALGTVFKAFA